MIHWGDFRAHQVHRFADILKVKHAKLRIVLLAIGWYGVAFVLGTRSSVITGEKTYDGFGPTDRSNAEESWQVYTAAELHRTNAEADPRYRYFDVHQAFIAGYLAKVADVDISTQVDIK